MRRENVGLLLLGMTAFILSQAIVILILYLLGKSHYGDYQVAILSLTLIGFICANGSNITIPKYLKLYLASNQEKKIPSLLSWLRQHLFRSIVLLALVIILILALTSPFYDAYDHPFILACVFFPISCVYAIITNSLNSVKAYNLSSFLQNAGLLGITSILLIFPFIFETQITSWVLFLMFIIAMLLASAFSAYIISINIRHALKHPQAENEDQSTWKTHSGIYLLSTIVNNTLPVLIPLYTAEYLLSNEHEVGTYATITTIAAAGTICTSAIIQKCAMEMFHYISNKSSEVLTDIKHNMRDLLITSVLLSAVVFVFSESIAHLYFKHETVPLDIDLIRLVSVVIPLFTVCGVLSQFFTLAASNQEVYENSIVSTLQMIVISLISCYFFGVLGLICGAIFYAILSTIGYFQFAKQSLFPPETNPE